jgi:hypothetical protein
MITAVLVVVAFAAGAATALALAHKYATSEALHLRRELSDLRDALRTAYEINKERSTAELEIANAARGYVVAGHTKSDYAKAATEGS